MGTLWVDKFGHLVFNLFSRLVIIFGHMVLFNWLSGFGLMGSTLIPWGLEYRTLSSSKYSRSSSGLAGARLMWWGERLGGLCMKVWVVQ